MVKDGVNDFGSHTHSDIPRLVVLLTVCFNKCVFYPTKVYNVVRLPQCRSDTEHVWTKVKNYIRNCYYRGSVTFTKFTEITKQAIMLVTEIGWIVERRTTTIENVMR